MHLSKHSCKKCFFSSFTRKNISCFSLNRYTIWDHKGEGVYVVTMDLAVCFEDGGDCLINTNVLDQAKLSKQTCVWGTSFLNPSIYICFVTVFRNSWQTSLYLFYKCMLLSIFKKYDHDNFCETICSYYMLRSVE